MLRLVPNEEPVLLTGDSILAGIPIWLPENPLSSWPTPPVCRDKIAPCGAIDSFQFLPHF